MPGCALHDGAPNAGCSFCKLFTAPTGEELRSLAALDNWTRIVKRALEASGSTSGSLVSASMTQAADARRIGDELGITLGASPHTIPQIIHRFWSGGPMSRVVMNILAETAQRARAAGWQCYLWYSTTIEDALAAKLGEERVTLRDAQRKILEEGFGYQVCFVEGLGVSANPGAQVIATEAQIIALARAAATSVIRANDWDDVKYFSDLARLLYLYWMGGIHMDVDMGIGTMDMTLSYRHNDAAGEIPLLGTLARDNSDVTVASTLNFLHRAKTSGGADAEKYGLAIGSMASRAVNGAGMFNALIASRPKTTHLAAAVREYIRRNTLLSGMALQPILLTGQGGGDPEEALKLTVPPYLLSIQQLTPESDA
jgi:hypothetical protein